MDFARRRIPPNGMPGMNGHPLATPAATNENGGNGNSSYFGQPEQSNYTQSHAVVTPFNGPPTIGPSSVKDENAGFAAALSNHGQTAYLSPVPTVQYAGSQQIRDNKGKPKRPSGLSGLSRAPPSPASPQRSDSDFPTPDMRTLSFEGRSESPQQISRHSTPSQSKPFSSVKQTSMLNLTMPSTVPLKRNLPTPAKASSVPQTSAQHRSKNARVMADHFQASSKSDVDSMLSQPDADSHVMIIDIRPHTKFMSLEQGHLSNSISLCAPTTLLRRAAFGLDRLSETLPDAMERERFLSSIKSDSSTNLILAVDQDSTALFDDSPLCSLLSKFEKAGFEGKLTWVHGGYQALHGDADFMEKHKYMEGNGQEADSLASSPGQSSSSSRAWPQSRTGSSNGSFSSGGSASSLTSSFAGVSDRSGSFSDACSAVPQVRLLPGQAFDSRSTQSHKLGMHPSSKGVQQQCANPFFDTIRQNHEALSLESSMSNVVDVHLRADCENPHFTRQLPACLRSLAEATPTERGQKLAHEFYLVEAAEQKRLQEVLNWSSQARPFGEKQPPFSISAGMEKGALNRYKNIFPYEHSRCHLQVHDPSATDYINASHVRFKDDPEKTYIASQGPLPSTYEDFWQLVDQENVGVVVMLTNIVEGGREKCGKYYIPGQYGRFQISCPDGAVHSYPGEGNSSSQQQSGGFFSSFDLAAADKKQTKRAANSPSVPVCRSTLQLHRPDGTSRAVRHIKFAGWPDFDVPPDAETLLDLISEVNEAKEEIARMNGTKAGPVVVHCSAGVGRTGSYMLVDVLLDMYQKAKKQHTKVNSHMDVDSASPLPSPVPQVLDQPDYLRKVVDEMREHRMSMVANYAQYQFCYQAILIGCQRIEAQDLH